MITITERDPVTTSIDDVGIVENVLTVEAEYWKQGPFHKEKHTYDKKFYDRRGHFWTGSQKLVIKYLNQLGLEYTLDRPDYAIRDFEPGIEGITFREDQEYALGKIREDRRGVWQAPTRSGKTVIMAGVISMYKTSTALIIVHTKALFDQTVEEMTKFFPENEIGQINSEKSYPQEITVAMKTSLANRMKKKAFRDGFGDRWGVVIVDEAHHISTQGGEYAWILQRIYAPIRIGLTATLPKTEEGTMCMEGLLGPVIGTTRYEELKGTGVLAKPKMRFEKVYETDMYKHKRYPVGTEYRDVYSDGIVYNRKRNVAIIDVSKEYINEGLSVLIMIERIKHGEELLKLLDIRMPGVFTFLYSDIDDKVLNKELKAFKGGKRKGVIATRIWCEGIDIKSIRVVINGVGGDSEIAAIQRFGRGFGMEGDKEQIVLVDFLDTNHEWFQKHTIDRLCFYSGVKWI